MAAHEVVSTRTPDLGERAIGCGHGLGVPGPGRSHGERQARVHAWQPLSPCTAGCAARGARGERASRTIVVSRLLRIAALVPVVLVLLGTAIAPARVRDGAIRGVARAVLAAFGVKLLVEAPAGDTDLRTLRPADRNGRLVTANHTSWLDIVVHLAIGPTRFLSRADVGRIPVLGALARSCGTLLIERSSLRALPGAVSGVAAALRDGSHVTVFPEATTWCGASHGTFRPALFQAAKDSGCEILPVRVRVESADGRLTTGAAFVGGDSVIPGIRRLLAAERTVVRVVVGELIDPAEGDRVELARRAGEAVFGDRSRELPPVRIISESARLPRRA